MPARVFKGVFVVFSLYCLLFLGIPDVGLLSADEPRYAAIGRDMALTGDWITPRLWGEPWFEKPPLLYWMIALAWKARLADEWAARLPVALTSLLFLLFYYHRIKSIFDPGVARYASMMLATSVAWLGFSAVAVTDLPMAACFAAAVLLAMPGRGMPGLEAAAARIPLTTGALLGLAVLAKGLVPLVLVLPLLWIWRDRWRTLLAPALVCAAVAAPWFLLCYFANGHVFVDEFIVKHHIARFTSASLQHTQPWWFYVPVLIAGLLPWTPAAAGLLRRDAWADSRLRQLGLFVVFGFVFFSLSRNKLPGYLLPLVPLAFALLAARAPRQSLPACAFLAALLPAAGLILPPSLSVGISRADIPLGAAAIAGWAAGALLLAAAIHWKLPGRAAPAAALAVWAVIYVKTAIYPELDRLVSARLQWLRIADHRGQVCLDNADRDLAYGLAYYNRGPLPDCQSSPRPVRLTKP